MDIQIDKYVFQMREATIEDEELTHISMPEGFKTGLAYSMVFAKRLLYMVTEHIYYDGQKLDKEQEWKSIRRQIITALDIKYEALNAVSETLKKK